MSLFPLDTIKTRLQASEGFWKAGGFRGVYKGLGAAAAGSAPGAALFFSIYETIKIEAEPLVSDRLAPLVHMVAASVGETGACLIRVPTENVKQNLQAGRYNTNAEALRTIWKQEDLAQIQVFTNFRGNFCLCIPQIPFSFLQFPMYEAAKAFWAQEQGRPVSPLQAAACGSVAGAVAAAVTTPLDVIKTRLILEKDMQGRKYHGIVDVFRRVVAEEGPMTLFAGVAPRVMWITIGGFVYFGAYEEPLEK
ncbi:s-adenosylmethionine mitochondrial carrier protein [Nannochloropsis gaditana CCMP526]|uniref:s-adenosylmethionine mitochondrial carrier protein n=1 Tax=Nannochloropsis gaditana (strain CCMP526) TaxID=1093141 RepID=UPI00029F7A2E|nr:s-adenosylmethionine mitochondrial carrier protein [Nannochloropsis gaditana CCMP526]EKU20240.1 s-adenosylmethionine mitochondrial carrier protein [Nannochloropsis gaditana CCMP526]|eukprot:XP_005856104.1 s-adenosylmethionine mitochondrial carrier protein [Nannochloropsis gaditana CCMP526]